MCAGNCSPITNCNQCCPPKTTPNGCIVRFNGADIDCLGITTGDTFETIIAKVASFVCDIQFEDGKDGVGIENMAYDSVTDTLTVLLSDASTYSFTGLKGDDGLTPIINGIGNWEIGGVDTGIPATGPAGANGIDANSLYGNTLFVDIVYGDDATALRERFDLPYATIMSAIAASTVGDRVWVRSGVYNENIVLKNAVNIHFEDVTNYGSITDSGNTVACNISGSLKINFSGSNAIYIYGALSIVNIKLVEIIVPSVAIKTDGGIGSYLNIEVDRIIGLNINYFITPRGSTNLTVKVNEKMSTQPTTSGFSGIYPYGYSGRFVLDCPYVYIGNSTDLSGGSLFMETLGQNSAALIDITIGRVDNDYDLVGHGPEGLINKYGSSKAFIRVGKADLKVRSGIYTSSPSATGGSLLFSGNIKTRDMPTVVIDSDQTIILKNCIFERESATDSTVVNISKNNGISILNSEIKSILTGTIGVNNGIITKALNSGTINIKDTDIYFKDINTPANTAYAAKTSGTGMYFKNVVSNMALDAPTTDISAVGVNGFEQDINLIVHSIF